MTLQMTLQNLSSSKRYLTIISLLLFSLTPTYAHYVFCDGVKYHTETIPDEVKKAYNDLYQMREQETCFITGKMAEASVINDRLLVLNNILKKNSNNTDINLNEIENEIKSLEEKLDENFSADFPKHAQIKSLEENFDKINYLKAQEYCQSNKNPNFCSYKYENIKDITFRLRSCAFHGDNRKFPSCNKN